MIAGVRLDRIGHRADVQPADNGREQRSVASIIIAVQKSGPSPARRVTEQSAGGPVIRCREDVSPDLATGQALTQPFGAGAERSRNCRCFLNIAAVLVDTRRMMPLLRFVRSSSSVYCRSSSSSCCRIIFFKV